MPGEDRYSPLDRLLHRIAFASLGIQKSLADLEDYAYRKRLRDVRVLRPVFIAGLPRCGTTLLLETLRSLGNFAVHTYRHMPFVLAPMLWGAFWRRFRIEGKEMERAHGDGMVVGFDSAEAFEEIAWRTYWPGKYREDSIEPWSEEDLAGATEFEAFFKSHAAKLIAMREREQDLPGDPPRYLSKNNANIARVPVLRNWFPDATILAPFRRPLDQAGSMRAQHLRFLDLHDREPFSMQYMADVGHFEFGRNRRPIDFGRSDARGRSPGFGGFADTVAIAEAPDSIDGWLSYWCAAYEHVLAQPPNAVELIDYDRLCDDPEPGLRHLAAAAGIEEAEDLTEIAARFRAPNRYAPEALSPSETLLARAESIHRRLADRAASARAAIAAGGGPR